MTGTALFSERERVPLVWLLRNLLLAEVALLAYAAIRNLVLPDGRGPALYVWLASSVVVLALILVLLVRRTRVRVEPDAVSVSPGTLRFRRDAIRRVSLASGADLSRLRRATTTSPPGLRSASAASAGTEPQSPSWGVHCPPWHRRAVVVVTGDRDDRRRYLIGLRDVEGFRAALGRDWDPLAETVQDVRTRAHG